MWRYICLLSAIMLMLCGITFLLSSCAQEIIDFADNSPTGKMVDVKFVLKSGSYGASEVVPYGMAADAMQPETVVVPVEDGLYMYATLQSDQGVNLRAASNLDENTKLRIVAYSNNNAVASADYTIKNGQLDYAGGLLQVNEGQTYTFVAYSYNRTDTLPSHSEFINDIDPDYDLLYASVTKKIQSSNDEIGITLSHKFSKVAVRFTTDSLKNPTAIIGILGYVSGYTAKLEPLTGDVTNKEESLQVLRFPSFGATNVTSTARTVFTGKNATSVDLVIPSIVLEGHNAVLDQAVKFDKQLKSGVSYTLKVVFRNKGNFIYAEPNSVYLSPAHPSRTINVTSSDAWSLFGNSPTNATLGRESGLMGTMPLQLDRSTTVFGNQTFTLCNNANGLDAVVTVNNLYIKPETLYISNGQSQANIANYDIDVYGGSEHFTIVQDPNSRSSWINSPAIHDGKLQFSAAYSLSDRPVGYITLAHEDDPDYQVVFPVVQDKSVLAPFDYLTIKFIWAKEKDLDLDIAVEFADNELPAAPGTYVPFDNNKYYGVRTVSRAVGNGLSSYITADGTRAGTISNGIGNPNNTVSGVPVYPSTSTILQDGLMFWGGDATNEEGETVLLNASHITPSSPQADETGWPRYLKIKVWAAWFHDKGLKPATVRVSTYAGGTMLKPTSNIGSFYTTNFYTVAEGTTSIDRSTQTRTPIFDEAYTVSFPNLWQQGYQFRTTYKHVCTITYDRYRNDAMITWH